MIVRFVPVWFVVVCTYVVEVYNGVDTLLVTFVVICVGFSVNCTKSVVACVVLCVVVRGVVVVLAGVVVVVVFVVVNKTDATGKSHDKSGLSPPRQHIKKRFPSRLLTVCAFHNGQSTSVTHVIAPLPIRSFMIVVAMC